MTGQLELPFPGRGESPRERRSDEAPKAASDTGHSGASGLLEAALSRRNLKAALKRVKGNKGSPGIDGMTVGELAEYLRGNGRRLREELLAGSYQPQPVRRHAIPKSGGGMR